MSVVPQPRDGEDAPLTPPAITQRRSSKEHKAADAAAKTRLFWFVVDTGTDAFDVTESARAHSNRSRKHVHFQNLVVELITC